MLTCSSEGESEVFLGQREVEEKELRAVFRQWDPRIRTQVENGHGYLNRLLLDNSQTELSLWVHAGPEDNLSLALVGNSAHSIGPYM